MTTSPSGGATISFGERLLADPVTRERRALVTRVMSAALEAVDPAEAVRRALTRDGGRLTVGDRSYDLDQYERVLVVGAGKASAPMAVAVEEVLGERVAGGLVVVKHGHTAPTRIVTLREASHPIPDETCVNGTAELVSVLDGSGPRDLVIVVLSGGGSALMLLPAAGITLADMQQTTDLLLRAGATINELNTIRKHLERAKGGGLARLAAPSDVVTLVLSDVVGNPLDVIASGPTVPDTSTFADACAIVERLGVWDRLPSSVLERLQAGRAGRIDDTPKPGDPIFERVQTVVVASNELAAEAAVRQARAEGLEPLLLTTYVEGEAAEVAKVIAALAREEAATNRPLPRPCCLVLGGETTVHVRGDGLGGRNQELALAAALKIAGLHDVIVVALATDGNDGPTDATGALVDGTTVQRARARGLDPEQFLARNDAYHFFEPLGDLLVTGPTNTNVNDLLFVFAW
ncbi:MAG: glycerate kinase [Chloroflexi bacterium]|nr:glycerate kinase [Chloroflexota bacterium]